MKRTSLIALLVVGCSGSGLSASLSPNSEAIVGGQDSVQITSVTGPSAAFDCLKST
jgi:hypothetical protein